MVKFSVLSMKIFIESCYGYMDNSFKYHDIAKRHIINMPTSRKEYYSILSVNMQKLNEYITEKMRKKHDLSYLSIFAFDSYPTEKKGYW